MLLGRFWSLHKIWIKDKIERAFSVLGVIKRYYSQVICASHTKQFDPSRNGVSGNISQNNAIAFNRTQSSGTFRAPNFACVGGLSICTVRHNDYIFFSFSSINRDWVGFCSCWFFLHIFISLVAASAWKHSHCAFHNATSSIGSISSFKRNKFTLRFVAKIPGKTIAREEKIYRKTIWMFLLVFACSNDFQPAVSHSPWMRTGFCSEPLFVRYPSTHRARIIHIKCDLFHGSLYASSFFYSIDTADKTNSLESFVFESTNWTTKKREPNFFSLLSAANVASAIEAFFGIERAPHQPYWQVNHRTET